MTRALIAATVVVTATVAGLTVRLVNQASPDIAIDWVSWTIAVISAYVGLAMVGWWVRDRERGR